VEKLDARVNAFRPDLADENLRGQVEAQRFVKGETRQINAPAANILKRPEKDSPQTSQALMGELCHMYEEQGGFAWVQMVADHYVGYVDAAALSATISTPTHRVSVPSTLLFPLADLKSHPVQFLHMNARLQVLRIEGAYAAIAGGGFIYAKHLAPLTEYEPDFVSVAERFLHAPYYWGGKTVRGLDCSGLVQSALHACGIESPRDSDMQEKNLGAVVKGDALQRGDLVFWSGHVGIMQSHTQLLHANGHFMMVTSEPLTIAIARSEKPVSSVRRLSAQYHIVAAK